MATLTQQLSGSIRNVAMALVAGLLAFYAPDTTAAPFTSHFDNLLTDLHTRAAALSNSTDKVQQTQFKTIVKVLKTFEGKPSTSLATDIKNLGSAAKALGKAFPTDFTPPGSSLQTNMETALDGLIDDVQTLIDTTETNLNALAASACKDKAQIGVDAAQSQLDNAAAATDFATAAKLLGTALKTELKADKAVTKCSSQGSGSGGGGGGGGGSGDFLSATVSGALNLSFTTKSQLGFVIATLEQPVNIIEINAGQGANSILNQSMALFVDNVTGPGTYPIDFATSFTQEAAPLSTFFGAAGTITFTTADIAGQKLVGSFGFTEPQQLGGTGTLMVTSGTFNISKLGTAQVTVPTTNFMTATDNGFSFWGSSSGLVVPLLSGSELLITGQNQFLTLRNITLAIQNPTTTGVSYPLADGSNYTDEHHGLTTYTNNLSGAVVFSTLDLAQGKAEGTFTFSASQTTPPGTDTVTIINGHFKNSNIVH